jgi:hypothetical protein
MLPAVKVSGSNELHLEISRIIYMLDSIDDAIKLV